MRLLSWNIHKGIGGADRLYAPGRIAEVIRHYEPDLVVLQEVASGIPRCGRDRQAALLGIAADLPHQAYGPTVHLKTGHYGNATLSRYPLADVRHVGLQFSIKKRRAALYTRCQIRMGSHRFALHVLNVHLGLSGVERRWQIRRLLESRLLAGLHANSRVLLAGDTNDWGGALPRGTLRRAGFHCATGRGVRAIRTFPAWGPVGSLDKVFLRGPVRSRHAFRSRLALAKQASDHLPVIVDLELETR